MNNISEKFEDIVKLSENDKVKYEQLSKFDDTMNKLKVLMPIEKPLYNLPQVDTIGRRTYSSLNKKCEYKNS